MTVATLPVTPKVTYEETSLHLPVGMRFDDWCAVGASLQQMQRSSSWWLGDWCIFGEQFFPEIYTQAIEDYARDTVQRAVRVGHAFPRQRRRNCSHSMHYAVLLLPEREQDELLDQAVTNEWTRETFREVLKAHKAAKEAAEKADSGPAPVLQLAPPTGETLLLDAEGKHESAAEAEIIGAAAPSPKIVEPSEPVPETITEAIDLLLASLDILPYDIRVATEMLLRHHELLNDVLDAAAESLKAGWMMPSLDKAVEAAEASL